MANQTVPYVEPDCTIAHEGRVFESGGAAITEDRLVAYLAPAGVLTDWHGRKIGTYTVTSTWRTPGSFMSESMSQIRACVGPRTYTGRSAGEGMVLRARRLASELREAQDRN